MAAFLEEVKLTPVLNILKAVMMNMVVSDFPIRKKRLILGESKASEKQWAFKQIMLNVAKSKGFSLIRSGEYLPFATTGQLVFVTIYIESSANRKFSRGRKWGRSQPSKNAAEDWPRSLGPAPFSTPEFLFYENDNFSFLVYPTSFRIRIGGYCIAYCGRS